jgi:hypothetical protein
MRQMFFVAVPPQGYGRKPKGIEGDVACSGDEPDVYPCTGMK